MIVIGAGIIGLAVALETCRRGASVILLERGEAGCESSWAAAGMLSLPHSDEHAAMRQLCLWSKDIYPEWVRQIEAICGLSCDYDACGTMYVAGSGSAPQPRDAEEQTREQIMQTEPSLAPTAGRVFLLREESVDPRSLLAALLEACKREGVVVHHEHPVSELLIDRDCVAGVRAIGDDFHARSVVNCAGAWANDIAHDPLGVRVSPAKGQILSVLPHEKAAGIRHIVRNEQIYLVPRRDGRIIIGATVEDIGYDKRVEPDAIRRLHQLAADLVPILGQARITDAWAGLRPRTFDGLPIIAPCQQLQHYFYATGHFRNGILLAPATAKLVSALLLGETPELDCAAFAAVRSSAPRKQLR